MADNKDYLKNEQESGSVNISEEVLASIAGVAAMEVEGVVSLSSGLNFSELFGGKKNNAKGVKIQFVDSSVVIDVFMTIKYGFVIPTVAAQVQDKVISAIESMTGHNISAVNIHVSAVDFGKGSSKDSSAD